jgi:hypothetical protein
MVCFLAYKSKGFIKKITVYIGLFIGNGIRFDNIVLLLGLHTT